MQHVPPPLKAQKVSDPAAPELTFSWEPLASSLRDFALLLDRMMREVGHSRDVSPFDPDYTQYVATEQHGLLRFLAVRSVTNGLVGFAVVTYGPHVDFISTRWAQIAKIYLRPEYRGLGNGSRMRDTVLNRLRAEGVKMVMMAERNACPTPLWANAGAKPIETVYVLPLEP